MDRKSRHWGWTVALEIAPAASVNFAVAFAVAAVVGRSPHADFAAEAAVSAGLAAFLLVWIPLRRFGSTRPRFAIPSFEPLPVDSEAETREELDELFLNEVAPVEAAAEADDELLLDDILQTIGPEARVVQLFQPGGVPTAGELQARIERHLRSGCPRPAVPDASLALHEALAALRQSLR